MIDFVIRSAAPPRNVALAIYDMDGPDGEPGTLLGTSSFQPVPSAELGVSHVLSFEFDHVVVPEHITVTMNDDIPPGIPGTGGLFGPVIIGD